MKGRLAICATYLQEIESRLAKLQSSLSHDADGKAKATEALRFIQEAKKSISKAHAKVDELIDGHSPHRRSD
jgi:hypothetical protein